jgi:RNA polymerase sigma-70 factor, ECF subfamily
MAATALAEPTSPRPHHLDPASRAWLDGLHAAGVRRVQKLAELHGLLLRAARHELARRRPGGSGVGGKDREDLAEEIAGDALLAVVAKLGSYRGESRFTTWAYAFAVNTTATKLARWTRRPLPLTMDDEAWERLPDRLSSDPHTSAESREIMRALHDAVEQELTERQRQVFIAVALNEAPIDELAVQLGSNRGAVYKTLFDTRRKLRASLEAAGYHVSPSTSAPSPRRRAPSSERTFA